MTIKWQEVYNTAMIEHIHTTIRMKSHLVISQHGRGSDNETCNCQIHPSNQTAGCAKKLDWGHTLDSNDLLKSANAGSHQTVLRMWRYTQWSLHWHVLLPWLCLCKLGYQVLKKQLSQQLWLSGHQRECQKQFLTLGCSWLIFYLFDLKLTSLPHILI